MLLLWLYLRVLQVLCAEQLPPPEQLCDGVGPYGADWMNGYPLPIFRYHDSTVINPIIAAARRIPDEDDRKRWSVFGFWPEESQSQPGVPICRGDNDLALGGCRWICTLAERPVPIFQGCTCMLPTTTSDVLPATISNTCEVTANAQTPPLQQCEFYKCAHFFWPCPEPWQYLLSTGYRFCLLWGSLDAHVSLPAQQWLEGVRLCLQERLMSYLEAQQSSWAFEVSTGRCQQLRNKAVLDHSGCFATGNKCNWEADDYKTIFRVIGVSFALTLPLPLNDQFPRQLTQPFPLTTAPIGMEALRQLSNECWLVDTVLLKPTANILLRGFQLITFTLDNVRNRLQSVVDWFQRWRSRDVDNESILVVNKAFAMPVASGGSKFNLQGDDSSQEVHLLLQIAVVVENDDNAANQLQTTLHELQQGLGDPELVEGMSDFSDIETTISNLEQPNSTPNSTNGSPNSSPVSSAGGSGGVAGGGVAVGGTGTRGASTGQVATGNVAAPTPAPPTTVVDSAASKLKPLLLGMFCALLTPFTL